MVNLPFRNPDCDSYSAPLLDLFHSYNPSICSTMVLIVLLSRFSLALLQTKKGMPLIIADYGYSHADWDQLQDKQAP